MNRSNKKSEIAYTSDILKEVSRELGMELKVVENVYKSMMRYIQYLTNKTKSVAIFIPHLGTLHIRVSRILSVLETISYKKKGNEERKEIYEGKKQKLDEHLKGLMDANYTTKSRHFQRDKMKLTWYNSDMSIPQIEEKQNSRE